MVTCDLFELSARLAEVNGKLCLEYTLYTDLPAGTFFILSCERFYLNHRNEKCVWVGFDERMEVRPNVHGDFNGATGTIDIEASDKAGAERFADLRPEFSAGIKTPVSDGLRLSVVVGGRQRLKLFGKNNQQLNGQMVEDSGGLHIVRAEKILVVPMAEEFQPLELD